MFFIPLALNKSTLLPVIQPICIGLRIEFTADVRMCRDHFDGLSKKSAWSPSPAFCSASGHRETRDIAAQFEST